MLFNLSPVNQQPTPVDRLLFIVEAVMVRHSLMTTDMFSADSNTGNFIIGFQQKINGTIYFYPYAYRYVAGMKSVIKYPLVMRNPASDRDQQLRRSKSKPL